MGDRVHRLLGVVALVVVAAGFLGWKSLRSANAVKTGALPAPVPNPQLAPMIAYATPVADSAHIPAPSADSIVLPHDPFEGRTPPRVVAVEHEPAPVRAANPVAEQWRVTTTLMAGTRRAALINDELVYVGDPLPGGARLTSVERDHVVVTDTRGAAHIVAVVKEGNG